MTLMHQVSHIPAEVKCKYAKSILYTSDIKVEKMIQLRTPKWYFPLTEKASIQSDNNFL